LKSGGAEGPPVLAPCALAGAHGDRVRADGPPVQAHIRNSGLVALRKAKGFATG